MYANENGGRLPDDFSALLLTQDITSEVFICPSSQGERAQGDTPQEQAKKLAEPLHMTYVYVGKGMTAPPADRQGDIVVAYEHLGHHNDDGMNFLYADGHVEFQSKSVAQHLVSEIAAGHNPPRPASSSARR